MKIVFISLALLLIQINPNNGNDCSDAHSSADDAYTYSKRAFDSDKWTESKDYLRKAMGSFEEAMDQAEECGCEDAHSSADDGYSYAKRGFNSTDWEQTKDYARRAKTSADDTMSYAEDCSN
jgi:hypothetical protein